MPAWADSAAEPPWPDRSDSGLGTTYSQPSQPPAEIWGDFSQPGTNPGIFPSPADTGNHPIYVWNPGAATTDNFPTVVDSFPAVTDDKD